MVLTLHQLNLVMEGKLEPIFDALAAYYNTKKLEGVEGEVAA